MSQTTAYDYESMVWGLNEVRTRPTFLGAFRLRCALEDLRAVSGRVLEVGCGGGGMLRAIKFYRPDLEVYGCDISHRAVAEASSRSAAVEPLLAGAGALPFKSGEFRAVFLFDVLEHLENPERAISEVCRVLMRHGVLHASVPLEGEITTLQGLLRRLGWKAFARTVGHIQAFEVTTLRQMLSDLGFRNVQIRRSGHLISQLAHCAYVVWLSLGRGARLSMSVESYLGETSGYSGRALMGHLKEYVAVASYYESLALGRVAGAIAHVHAEKC